MTCTLAITSVRGTIGAAGGVESLSVSGSSEDCAQIELRVSCLDRATGGVLEEFHRVTVPVGASVWASTLTRIPDCIDCGRRVRVEARCVLDGDIYHPECEPAIWDEPLACGECPSVRVSADVDAECESAGRRRASFVVTIDAPAGIRVTTRIDYGDGTASGATSERFYTRTHSYVGSGTTLHPRIEVLDPERCPPFEGPDLYIEACPPPPPPAAPPCPRLISVTAGPAVGVPGGCLVPWVAVVDPPALGSYTWRFDGSSDTVTTRTATTTRTYTVSGRHWAEVTFDPDEERCVTHRWTGETEVEGCERARGQGEEVACVFSRMGAVIFLGIALAALAWAICAPTPADKQLAVGVAGVAGVLGLLLLFLWLALCPERPCEWGLLLGGEALLMAGMVLINLSRCCPVLAAVGLGLLAAAALLFLLWRDRCRMTWCALALELGSFNLGVLGFGLLVVAIFGCLPDLSESALLGLLGIGLDAVLLGISGSALACALSGARWGERDLPPPTSPGVGPLIEADNE